MSNSFKNLQNKILQLKKELEPHLIFCGDFNSKPGGLVHTYITSGEICTKHISRLKENNLKCPLHNLCLKSIHTKHSSKHGEHNSGGNEDVMFTNATSDFIGVIDYIFHASSLCVRKVLSFPKIPSNIPGRKEPILPTSKWASDHLAIGAEFIFAPK